MGSQLVAQGTSDGGRPFPSPASPSANALRGPRWVFSGCWCQLPRWVWPIPSPLPFLSGPWIAVRTPQVSACSLPRPPTSLQPEEGANVLCQGGQHPQTTGGSGSTAQAGRCPWRGESSRESASRALSVFPGTAVGIWAET